MLARQQAMNHLVNYLANHPRLASLSDPNIVLVADQVHTPLVEQLYVVMSQQFAACEQNCLMNISMRLSQHRHWGRSC